MTNPDRLHDPYKITIPGNELPPGITTNQEQVASMTIYYRVFGTSDNDRLLIAVLEPAEGTDPRSIGWRFDPSSPPGLHGPDAEAVVPFLADQRVWWIDLDTLPTMRPLIWMARSRDDFKDRVDVLQARCNDYRRQHLADVETIGNALMEEAVERGWCEEYDDFVDSLNAQLTFDLPLREREFDVEIEVSYTLTRTVRATSEDEASDLAEEVDSVDHGDANSVTVSGISVTRVDPS